MLEARRTRARQPERRVPAHARVGARDDPGRPRDARHDRGRASRGSARRSALLQPAELQGLVSDLQPAVADFAEFTDGQVEFLPRARPVQPLPVRRGPADRRAARSTTARFSTGLDELPGVLPDAVGLAGESARTSTATGTTRASSRAAALRGPDARRFRRRSSTAARRSATSRRSAPVRRAPQAALQAATLPCYKQPRRPT